MGFGIPVNALPFTDGGERKVTNHRKWIGRRRVKEDALRKFGTFNGIELPGKFHVIISYRYIFALMMRSYFSAAVNGSHWFMPVSITTDTCLTMQNIMVLLQVASISCLGVVSPTNSTREISGKAVSTLIYPSVSQNWFVVFASHLINVYLNCLSTDFTSSLRPTGASTAKNPEAQRNSLPNACWSCC